MRVSRLRRRRPGSDRSVSDRLVPARGQEFMALKVAQNSFTEPISFFVTCETQQGSRRCSAAKADRKRRITVRMRLVKDK